MTSTHTRRPAGSPEGGQFAGGPAGAEADSNLDTAELSAADALYETEWAKFNESDHPHDRLVIAQNAQSPQLLEELSVHWSFLVRQGVAKNAHTPEPSLHNLARDKDPKVRSTAARTLRTLDQATSTETEATAPVFAGPTQADVNAAKTPATKAALIKTVTDPAVLNHAAQSWSFMVRRAVANNPHTPVDTLTVMADDEDVNVRVSAAKSGRLPLHAYATLMNDPIGGVRTAAYSRLGVQRRLSGLRVDAESAGVPLDDATAHAHLMMGDTVQLRGLARSTATPTWAKKVAAAKGPIPGRPTTYILGRSDAANRGPERNPS